MMRDHFSIKKDIKLIVADVDGTLTDGSIYMSEKGDAMKKFNAKDGLSFQYLKRQGYKTALLSASKHRQIVHDRARMLGVDLIYVGEQSKAEIIEQWCNELGISPRNVAYIGDDWNDIPPMKLVGFSCCPADADPQVKTVADQVLELKGGAGCFREMASRFFLDL